MNITCKMAGITFYTAKAAKRYRDRTGLRTRSCTHCSNYHTEH